MTHHGSHRETYKPIIYLIRHGEKPPKIDGKDQNGLSAQGITRATGLVDVFSKGSLFNIGYILAQHPKKGLFAPITIEKRNSISCSYLKPY